MARQESQPAATAKTTLQQHICALSAGCNVDDSALKRHNIDIPTLKKLGEAYRMGWLHNVLSRITPLTMRRRDDYLTMADIFIETEEAAGKLLDRFDADLELFCSVAEIHVTEHMTSKNVSEELRAHVDLYNDIAEVLYRKFNEMDRRDPIQSLVASPIVTGATNPFIKDFIDDRFDRKKKH